VATHQEIDERSLRLAIAVAEKIDANPSLLDGVRAWVSRRQTPAYQEWQSILQREWSEVREALLDPGEEGKRRRQSSPFVGILTPTERWSFFPVKAR
jgi:hypothetical protein